MKYVQTKCDFCNEPADGKATQTNGYCMKHLKNAGTIKAKVGKDPKRYKIGGSLTVQGKYEPYYPNNDGPLREKNYPDGYTTWRHFCAINGKSEDNAAYKRFKSDGKAELFKGCRIIRLDTVWPKVPSIKISARIKRSGF